MRFAERVDRIPHRCSFYPQLGPEHPEGFVVSDTLIDGFYGAAISVVALREIAAKFPSVGICPRSQLEDAQAELAELRRENEDLKVQIAEADKFADAAEWTLNHFNTQVKQKPGRKPAAKAA